MWSVYSDEGVLQVDSADAQYIGNVNFKALHKPSCGGLPIEKNHVYFKSYEEVIQGGHHECGNCLQVSMELPIYAMVDDSAIFVMDGSVSHVGKIHYIHQGAISPFIYSA